MVLRYKRSFLGLSGRLALNMTKVVHVLFSLADSLPAPSNRSTVSPRIGGSSLAFFLMSRLAVSGGCDQGKLQRTIFLGPSDTG